MKCMLFVLSLTVVLSGCSQLTPVKPWERGYLSKPEMAWSADSMQSTLQSHIYFAKEAASGGGSAGGGGCGCN